MGYGDRTPVFFKITLILLAKAAHHVIDQRMDLVVTLLTPLLVQTRLTRFPKLSGMLLIEVVSPIQISGMCRNQRILLVTKTSTHGYGSKVLKLWVELTDSVTRWEPTPPDL